MWYLKLTCVITSTIPQQQINKKEMPFHIHRIKIYRFISLSIHNYGVSGICQCTELMLMTHHFICCVGHHARCWGEREDKTQTSSTKNLQMAREIARYLQTIFPGVIRGLRGHPLSLTQVAGLKGSCGQTVPQEQLYPVCVTVLNIVCVKW